MMHATAPCSRVLRTMSSGCFSWCHLLMPWKFKVRETNTEVSNEHYANFKFLTINCVQDLPTNELPIVSTKKERTSVEDRVVETNSKAVVRGLIRIAPGPAISLTHIYIQELPVAENELEITSATKGCTSVESEDRDMETNFEAAVRRLIHFLEIPAFSDAHLNSEIV